MAIAHGLDRAVARIPSVIVVGLASYVLAPALGLAPDDRRLLTGLCCRFVGD